MNTPALRSLGGAARGDGPPQSPFSPLDQLNTDRLTARGFEYHQLIMMMPIDRFNVAKYSSGTPACLLNGPSCSTRHDLKFAAADNEKWGCKQTSQGDVQHRFVRALCHFGHCAGIAILRCNRCGTALSNVSELKTHRSLKCKEVVFNPEDAPN